VSTARATSPFHDGERFVQERAGLRAEADKVGRIIGVEIPDGANAWLAQRELAALAAADGERRVWCSLLAHDPGFLVAEDAGTLRVAARPGAGDPLEDALEPGAAVGLVAIDLATRRRMRLNGVVASVDEAGFRLRTREVYGNCPKYIQARERLGFVPAAPPGGASRTSAASSSLDADAAHFVAAADTAFVATLHPGAGADASHRGGEPGFVRVVAPDRLEIPDYDGNRMFNTLGNLAVDPRIGLVFAGLDEGPDAGRVLQLSGTATIDFDPARAARTLGAQRILEMRIERVVDRRAAFAPRYWLRERSPFNPRAT